MNSNRFNRSSSVKQAGLLAASLLFACGPSNNQSGSDMPASSADLNSAGLDMSGSPPDLFGDLAGTITADMAIAPPPHIQFSDVTLTSELPGASQTCLVFRDLDGDGKPDILMAPIDDQAQFTGQLALYINTGKNTFSAHMITVPFKYVNTCAAADYDNDGLADIVVGGRLQNGSGVALLHNGGAGNFTMTMPAFDLGGAKNISSLGFLDHDADGLLDLFVGFYGNIPIASVITGCAGSATEFHCEAGATDGFPSRIFMGDGKSPFTTTALVLPVMSDSSSYLNAVNFIDWNGDGKVDMFQSVDFGRDQLNDGSAANFTDLLPALSANPYNHGMGAAFADFDKNGKWDAYVVEIGPDQFWLGQNDGSLAPGLAAAGLLNIERYHVGWSPVVGDFNSDGWPDLFVSNSALTSDNDELTLVAESNESSSMVPQLDFILTNVGAAQFSVTTFAHDKQGVAVDLAATAVADYDGDGLLDVAQVLYTSIPELRLLRNTTNNAGHYLGVKLQGVAANRDGAGAIVMLHDGATELDRRAAGTGGGATSTEVVYFGLGARTTVPALTIHWPGGATQEVTGPINADQILTVVQK